MISGGLNSSSTMSTSRNSALAGVGEITKAGPAIPSATKQAASPAVIPRVPASLRVTPGVCNTRSRTRGDVPQITRTGALGLSGVSSIHNGGPTGSGDCFDEVNCLVESGKIGCPKYLTSPRSARSKARRTDNTCEGLENEPTASRSSTTRSRIEIVTARVFHDCAASRRPEFPPEDRDQPSALRSSQVWRVSVVQVGTPVPRKSLSWVQTPADRATAHATIGQSLGSRCERARASSSRAA